MLQIKKKNETYLYIECDNDIALQIGKHFSYKIPNYKHMPAYKKSKGKWDGSIGLFSYQNSQLLYGHLGELIKFLKENNIAYTIDEDVIKFNNYTKKDIETLLEDAKLPDIFEKRYYQVEASIHALNYKRTVINSPTASGKSLIAYILLLSLLQEVNGKIAIIVPRTSLVEQMYSDFQEYGMDVEAMCARIYAKYPHFYPKQKIVITTWQSIQNMEAAYFHQFDAVIGDEAHGFSAKKLRYIMENCINAEYRIGMTGSMPDKINEIMLVEGLFGPKFVAATTDELIKKGYMNQMDDINVVILHYPEEECKKLNGSKYQEEISFLIEHKKRNDYLIDLTKNIDGNTLLLFSRVDKHGLPLYNRIVKEVNKPIYFVSGKVDTDERERIRKLVKSKDNAIIVASIGTFSTGINIPNLDNLILSAPTKAKKTLIQMIGRVLRKSSRNTKIWDIVDDLTHKNKKNYALEHGLERIKVFANQKFKYIIKKVNL